MLHYYLTFPHSHYLTTHSDTGILVAEGPFQKVLERCQTRICEICKKGGSPTRPILFLIFESVHHPILWVVQRARMPVYKDMLLGYKMKQRQKDHY